MPDFTISLSDEEVIVWLSFYPTVNDGLLEVTRRRTRTMADNIVNESTSEKNPNKLSAADLRSEIITLNNAGEIPTYAERHPEVAE